MLFACAITTVLTSCGGDDEGTTDNNDNNGAINITESVEDCVGTVTVSVISPKQIYGPYIVNGVTYKITERTVNGVKTADVEMMPYDIDGTFIGDLKLGSYKVSYMEFNDGVYSRHYFNDNLKFDLRFENCKIQLQDGEYEFFQETANGDTKTNIIEMKTDGVFYEVTNTFTPGNMPFLIKAVFKETGNE